MKNLLSQNEIQEFKERGVIGPFRIYEESEAKELLHQIRMKNIDVSQSIHGNDVNYDRHFDISELSKHISHRSIVNRVCSLLSPNVLCWRTEFFPKFPGNAGTEWHQVKDYSYATGKPMLVSALDDEDDSFLDLTVWTSFTESTIENGCMRFIPGSHKKLYYDEGKPIKTGRENTYKSVSTNTQFFGYDFQEFKIDPSWEPEQEEVLDMEMRPGECVMFSARCVHASHPNRTKNKTRFAITARYTPAYVCVYPEMERFVAHGGKFDLKSSRYGPVLVAGEDLWKHNNLRDHNNLSEPFKKL